VAGEVRVVVADSHALSREGLGLLLEAHGYTVAAEAASGEDAVAAIAEEPGCVALIDAMLADMSGCEVARRVRERQQDARIVILGPCEDEDAVWNSLAAGAHGYMLKDSASVDLFAAVDLVARGGVVVCGGVADDFLAATRFARPSRLLKCASSQAH
jgi:DNA-binding NarL/FixJ family response regulator